jgi:hypothetical protein
MRFFVNISLIISFLLVLGLGDAQAQWRGEKKIDGPSGFASDLSMVVSGNNHYAMFHTFINPNWTTYLAASQDGGRTWTRQATSYRKWPRFDAEGDLVVIAEGEQGPGGGHGGGQQEPDNFWVEVSQDGGQTYSLTQLNTDTLFDLWGYPAVKIDGNRVYLHWSEDDGVQYLQVSDDKGQTWLPDPMVIPVHLIHEMLEVSGDTIHGLRIEDLGSSGDEQLIYWRSIDAGQTWTEMRIDNDRAGTHSMAKAVLTYGEGRVSAAWFEFYAWNMVDLWFSTSDDNGTTWSDPVRMNDIVSPKNARANGFDMAADGDNLLFAYVQQPSAGSNLQDCWARYSSDGGTTWTESVMVNPEPSTLGYPMKIPHTALAGQRGVVTWVDSVLGKPDEVLMGAHTLDGGQTWTANQINIGKVWEGNEYAVGYDSEGAVGVAYESTTGHAYANALHQPFLEASSDLSPGSVFNMTINHAELSDTGGLALVVISGTGDGSATGGIPLPGLGGRFLPLDFDALTQLGLTTLVPLFLTGPIVGGSASTPSFTVPAGTSAGDVWTAAVVMKPGLLGSLTDTLKIN